MQKNFLEGLNFNWNLIEENDFVQIFKVIINKAKNRKLFFKVEYVSINTVLAHGFWICNPSVKELNLHHLIHSDLKKIVKERSPSYKKIKYFMSSKGKSLVGKLLL